MKDKTMRTTDDQTRVMARTRLLIQITLVVIFLGGGGAAAWFFIATKKQPEKEPAVFLGPLVEVTTINRADAHMIVEGFGTVQPKTSVQVVPEVAGKIIYLHPNLVNGGFFEADEPLVKVDPRDYELARQRAEASVARAQVKLEQEQAEAAVARSEWKALHPDTEPTSPLVLREPQIKEAQAELTAAQAELEEAQLNLQRTVVSLPYAGRVTAKHVDVGQYVQRGTLLAEVYGTDVVEIPVPLEQKELAWFDLPRTDGSGGANVRVAYEYAGRQHERSGRVVRSEAEVSRTSRMISVIVEVKNPFDTTQADPGAPGLVPGQFATVQIQGHVLDNIIGLPGHALHEGDNVWIVRDNKLHIQPVQVVRRTRDRVYISGDIPDKAMLVLTSLEVVTDGMKVRTPADEPQDANALPQAML